jgi:hypothetical protein
MAALPIVGETHALAHLFPCPRTSLFPFLPHLRRWPISDALRHTSTLPIDESRQTFHFQELIWRFEKQRSKYGIFSNSRRVVLPYDVGK